PPAPPTPSADAPRNAAVGCGPAQAVRDPGASVPPDPNQDCQNIVGAPDMERQRPFGPSAADAATGGIMQLDDNPRIHIAHQVPKDPVHQMVYDTVRQRHMLEMVRKIFSPWLLGDINLNIRTTSCDGVPNAWYQRVNNVPTVSICYEYLQEIWESMPEEMKAV